MRQGNLVFAQLTTYLSLRSFRRCEATIGANKRSRTFSFLVQFIAMAFTHLTYRESLCDIVANLRAQAKRLYNMSFRCQTISRKTPANGNAHNVSGEQSCVEARADCRPVPPALAGRGVLQVDQTASAHQGISGHQRERGEDANLDCSLHLCADCDPQETPAFAT